MTREDKTRQDNTTQDKTTQDKTTQDKTRQDKTGQEKGSNIARTQIALFYKCSAKPIIHMISIHICG